MVQVFQAFQICVAFVSYGCYKSNRGMLHMLHMLQLFQRHVASVCFECFRCFRGMFHLYSPDACCKCVYLDVAYVLHIHCMCFGCLRMVAMVLSVFQVFFKYFRSVFLSVSTTFRRMLKLLYLDVSKVDRVLHLSSHLLLHRLSQRRG
jgi:hypothetical protein